MTGASGDGSVIAVVGISCRLPHAPGPQAYWQLLAEGREAISELPAERWQLADLSPLDFEDEGGSRLGGFLEGVERFDPAVFGISPAEAAAMDPQQRLALELAWEALEDGGVAPSSLRGSSAGVFLGAIAGDYATLADRRGPEQVNRRTAVGLYRSIIANRISYVLGLGGPSLTVDAAQSSSLVAVHLACESIRRGESELALAGGVHLNLDPRGALSAARAGALSPSGRCFAFDARADGFVRGEGGGVVVLKPLASARADGDPIYCLIRGSAANNDGGGPSLTSPNQAAQEAVLASAYRRAGVKRSEVQYVEAHGSGTPIGDPVEAAALGKVLGSGRTDSTPLLVGSAKTNVGHLEGAAGIAGLIKLALAIDRRQLPASLNFEQPNPKIPLQALGLRVQDESGPWPRAGELLAGVSSFGVGGTNCHVVLAEDPARNQKKSTERENISKAEGVAAEAPPLGLAPLVLSAASRRALRAQAERIEARLEEDPELDLADLGYSLARARARLGQRAVLIASDREGALGELGSLAAGEEAGLVAGAAPGERSPVFLFSGQGSHWLGMGIELARASAVFSESLEECEAALAPHVDFSLREALEGGEGAPSLYPAAVLQPVVFAMTISLARLWLASGVTPAAVAGHSQGEIAAACIAGGLSLSDGAMIAAVRSRLLEEEAHRSEEKSGMVSVAASGEPLASLLVPYGDRLTLAAENGAAASIVAGEREALDRLLEACAASGVKARDLVGGRFASHSHYVEPLREETVEALAAVSPRSSEIPFYSAVTGGLLDTAELDAEYWFRNMRQTVRFEAVTRQLLEQGRRLFIEASSHPVLAVPVEATIEQALDEPEEATVLATLRRDQGSPERFARSLAEAHVAGAPVEWSRHFAGARRVPLPTYPFQRQRYWLDDADEDSLPTIVDGSGEELAAELAQLPAEEREGRLLALVRAEAAIVLGRDSASIEPGQAFKELGLDSAGASELRKRLRAASGLRIGSTAVFDCPTPAELARHLLALATGESGPRVAVRAETFTGPIAIVGMSCRLPGASSPRQLWRLLAAGTDATAEFPADRGWDLQRLFDPDPDRPGTTYARRGGFLAGAADFDSEFFAISPREALAMDPQQRQLLEASWEACEDAGIDPAELSGSATGVFAGISSQDYGGGQSARGDVAEGYRLTGSATSVASGRVSYALGLEGPAMTIDTACSSSLVAMHLAAGALRGGECSLALAGGATVLGSAGVFTEISRQRGLAPDGRCKAFADAANGAVFSEGVGVLVLERLADAEANGHRVLATIRGSAVNQDGASNGLTAPNGPSQERVIRQALANAGLGPAEVELVEAHGTGTALGDPIEANALIATYGQEREEPVRLGSLKSNIGHAQAAAGVAGVIKAVMAMREGVMPKTLHLERPSSKVEWERGKIELLGEAMAWPRGERPRRAAVSSFGVSGTNAHLILEEAPAAGAKTGEGGPRDGSAGPLGSVAPLPLSAKTDAALAAQAERLASHLREHPQLDLADVGYSLATARPAFARRAIVATASRGEALIALDSLAQGIPGPPALVRGSGSEDTKVAFVFSGQGSQWQGMARELIDSSPVFAGAISECEEALEPHLDFALREVIEAGPGAPSMDRVEVVQPTLFAVAVSLARLWRACGVEPAAVVGHSQGEIAAAHIAGGLSLEDAALIIAARSRLIATLAGSGGMASLIAPRERVRALISPWADEIEIAAYNGPSSTIVSGARAALDGLLERCAEEGVRARAVAAGISPSHTHYVEVLREEILATFAGLSPRSGSIPFHSTVTGGVLDTAELDAGYWYRNARQPVLFETVCRGLVETGHRALIEVSPHPVFALAMRETIEQLGRGPDEATVIETLRRDDGGPRRFSISLATAHAAGAPIDWRAFHAGSAAKTVPLPTYPFQRKRFWLSPTSGGSDPAALGQSGLDHPFLAAAIEQPEGAGVSFSGLVSLAEHPWLADHAILGAAILPGTALLELALRAGAWAGAPTVEELTLEAPLTLPEKAVQLRLSLSGADEEGRRELSIHSRPEGEEEGWVRNATGTLSAAAPALPDRLPEWPPQGAEEIVVGDLRARLEEAGFEYGEAFAGLEAAWRSGAEIYAELVLPDAARGVEGFGVHPALLDAALHPAALEAGTRVSVPFSWSGVSLQPGGAGSELRVRLTLGEGEGAALELFDGAGVPVGRVGSVVARPLDPGQMQGAAKLPLFVPRWRPVDPPAALAPAELWRLPRPAPAAGAAREVAAATLEKIQSWLAAEGEDGRLAILTEGAVATGEGESADPGAAAAWGLACSAASENPGRLCLIDSDGGEASEAALERALSAEEPQIALRNGELLVPRLEPETESGGAPRPLDPERTVLITGATGALGGLLARHLVEVHGVRHLLLASLSGTWARGSAGLQVELGELGAEVTLRACDISDRGRLEELLSSVPAERPLGAIVHCAAVLEDATVQSAGAEQLQRVLAPKAEAAQYLHELTRELDLTHFVCFSSIAGLLGSPGQGAYAAANCSLDALAALRQAEGLPATSVAWGPWARESGVSGHPGEAGVARLRRFGIEALADDQGLALFDSALSCSRPLLAAVRFDRAALRAQAEAGGLAAPLRGLVAGGGARTSAAGQGTLARRLREAPQAARVRLAEHFVRAEVAAILGHPSAEAIGPNDAFKDLGFDSLAAVELRNRLNLATGLQLPATVVFDFPDAAALSGKIVDEATGSAPARPASAPARSSEEPIAIVGMACRYPGGVSSPAGLWSLLEAGSDGIAGLPSDRGWDAAEIYAVDPERPELAYAHAGGFLDDAADFDAGFFGISPREAVAVDPQQRLALESSWEALEDAGIDPHGLRGCPAGVFAGVMHHDYGVAASDSSGMAAGAASGRVSYALGLEGPAMTIDTACSSSLVAMHLAAGALRGGECSLALAGGVTVLARPSVFSYFSRQQGLARDGRSKPFAEAADGVGISEGVGMLVLERLSDAEANGHRVLATIRGSAVNQDGASNGITAPNGPAQERVIRQALANAGLEGADVDMVEAHGTGTPLGDPIEAGALIATYGQQREEPVRLGSLKSNIGHTQAAAGVGGVIKAVLAMREGLMPKTLHLDSPSSRVEWEAGRVELLGEATPWPQGERPRRAAVSSFGISGTNAHLILEEAPVAGRDPGPGASAKDLNAGEASTSPQGPLPFVLSAKSEAALQAQAERLAAHLRENPELGLGDLAFSLATTRAQLEQRAVVLASEHEQLLGGLDALARGERPANSALAKARPRARLAYLLSGQGAQRPGMGRELYGTYPAYAGALDGACAEIDPLIGRSLKALILSEPGSEEAGLLDHTTYAQPALFATEVALYRLLESKGLRPDLLTGHSVGEITAAHLSGVFDLPDAAKLICARGALMGALPAGGAMLAIEASEAEASELISGQEEALSLAAVNSPASCVISGSEEAIAGAEASWQGRGQKTKRLAVSHAFHSPLMEPMLAGFAELAATLTYNPPQTPVVSCSTGQQLTPERATDPATWVSHVREPVRFAAAVETLAGEGATAFVELGPDPVLCAMARECLGDEQGSPCVSALRQGRAEPESLIGALATISAAGAEVDWAAFFAGSGASAVPLPTYPFQRKRYWLSPASGSSDPTAMGQTAVEHPFLAAAIEDPEGEGIAFSGRISLAEHPWLADHAVLGAVLLPGTAFLEAALFAGEQVGTPTVQELTLGAPLVLEPEGATALRVSLSAPDEQGNREISIHSRPEATDAQWTRNASGTLTAQAQAPPEPIAQWPPAGAEQISIEDLRARLTEAGFEYGEAFEGLAAAWRLGEEVYAEAQLPESAGEVGGFGVHPALLDAVLHPLAFKAGEGIELPFTWSGISLPSGAGTSLRVRLSPGEGEIPLALFDGAGIPVGQVSSLSTRPLDPRLRVGVAPLYELDWQKLAPAAPTVVPTEVWRAPCSEEGAEGARALTLATLDELQAHLAQGEQDSRLAILTKGALITSEAEAPDLAHAALAGLLRSAAAEHPGRFCLIDSDGSEASEAALQQALEADPRETEIALREGELLVPRLVAAKAQAQEATELDPERTVLITGATSGIGALIAQHLVEAHGARHLLLVSRSGEQAPGALDLRARLQEQGAEVTVAACDVSERSQLEDLFNQVPAEHPLGAVIHSAAVLEDGLLGSMDQGRLQRVFAPKAHAAWHLHQLSAELDLSHFVCFSSIAGLLGSPAQANYAAANAFCDALVAQRRAAGLAGVSLAWGLWLQRSGMVSRLSEADLARVRRGGIAPLSEPQGLALFDSALAGGPPLGAAVRFDRAALRARAQAGELAAVLERVAGPRERASANTAGALHRRLREAPEAARPRLAEDFVRAEVAAILGHPSAADIGPNDAFKDLGFDSLAAIELRNRLSRASGRRLAASVVFDHPSAAALAAHLLGETPDVEPAAAPRSSRLTAQLEEASDEELLAFIDAQAGSDLG